ncbi:hypothetical protein [Runella zeae]|uniref:hypothetical protein n=1 Tax=Runella zeae TaxID=94255 RepID=UPI0004042554|nr:hypothetical protein [Runella zeae]
MIKTKFKLWMCLVFTFTTVTKLYAQSSSLNKPLSVYINWASYDELSDTVRLTESLAMKQLDELVRLKKEGLQLDYYLMDAFWFERNSGYRAWRKKDWPNGPEKWLKSCEARGVKPGLWFSTNVLHAGGKYILEPVNEWQSSLSKSGKSLCLFKGGYLPHLMETLELCTQQGFELFKFDFADFYAITPELEGKMSMAEIKQANQKALINALKTFRQKHPNVVFVAYNGFGGEMSNTGVPISKKIDLEWLTVFDAMYCGDPRPADVPTKNFWRSKDIYSDHMVKYFRENGLQLSQIDNSGFMIGKTGTCYFRGNAAWKGMALLSMARGGWLNTYYGNLELLTSNDAKWFAKAQRLWYPLQQKNSVKLIGGTPGKSQPYGYLADGDNGTVVCIVNPSQSTQYVDLPNIQGKANRILFKDAGFIPKIQGSKILLGAEQLVLVGIGEYANAKFDLGVGDMVSIPREVKQIPIQFTYQNNQLKGEFTPKQSSDLRFVFQQFDNSNIPFRSSGGSPPDGLTLANLLNIQIKQGSKSLPLKVEYDKAIWSGLSWAVAELPKGVFQLEKPIEITFKSAEKIPLKLTGSVYLIK